MTIQEAIKSGKPFRRKGWDDWCEMRDEECIDEHYESKLVRVFGVVGSSKFGREMCEENILATDWEIKPEPREFYVADQVAVDAWGRKYFRAYLSPDERLVTDFKVREVID